MSMVEKFMAKQMVAQAVQDIDEDVAEQDKPEPVVVLANQIAAAREEGKKKRKDAAPLDTQAVIASVGARFDKTHFVSPEGSNVYVWIKYFDPALRRYGYRKMSFTAFTQQYCNDMVYVPDGKGGQKLVSVATVWLNAPSRPTYPGGMMCCPDGEVPDGVFNTFMGWGVEAIEGDVSLILEFILQVICSGNKTHAKYLIKWMAFCVQHPSVPPGVAVVLVGGKGCGKTTLGELFNKLHGAHGMTVSDPKFLTGSFNAHMRDLLFMFCDESFWAGDKAAEGTLKARVTGQTLTIEAKGVDAITAPNMMSIMMATNNEHAVPSSSDERRWFVLRVSNVRQGDFDYWDKLNDNINNGGAEAFLHYLQNFDLADFNVRSVPHTEELANQKIHSFGALADFMYQALAEGTLCSRPWDERQAISRSEFTGRVEEYCQRHPRHRFNVPQPQYIGRHLLEMVGVSKGRSSGASREYTYKFPPLNEARVAFVTWARLGDDFQWEAVQ